MCSGWCRPGGGMRVWPAVARRASYGWAGCWLARRVREIGMSATDTTGIRLFRIETPEADLRTMRDRVTATRWPHRELVDDRSQGVQSATLQALADFWTSEYDWRACEEKLNALPQFMTEIDGLDIHFIHVRSKHEDALPVIITHGWPGSVIELLDIVGPLT